MIDFLARVYRKTGIHAAPPGTLLHGFNHAVRSIVHRRAIGYATDSALPRARFGGLPYYNVTRLRQTRPVNGLALIFFIGAGDYLMATPMIKALHDAHPDLPIWAYVSSHADSVNSPIVLQLLRTNPLVHRVSTYRGRPRHVWTEYDFSDALNDVPDDFAVLPVIYDTDPQVLHRGTSLLETFGLRVEPPIPVPLLYPTTISPAGSAILAPIETRFKTTPPKGIVVTHFGARSSAYTYPHSEQLVSILLERGYWIVSFSPTGRDGPDVTEIDVTKIEVTDSIEILRGLKTLCPDLALISVNSLMWPISAGLRIPNLGMHVFRDESVHQYVYPSIFVMTRYIYGKISPCRLFLAPPASYVDRAALDNGTRFTDYKPEYVADSFETMLVACRA